MSRLRALYRAALGLVFGLACSAVAKADGPRVLLVSPPGAVREVSVALVRVQGELIADGFEVVTVEAAPGTTSEAAMSQAENGSSTTIGLFLSPDGASAELWVVDRLTNKTVVRHVVTAGESQKLLPEVLAVKAVELLRASLLELVVERNTAESLRGRARASAQRASDWAARPIAEHKPRWALETGAAVIWSPTQVDPAFVSVARGRRALSDRVHVRVSFTGLGTRAQVSGTGGSAAVVQWCALAEGVFQPLPQALLKPMLTLGAGTFHTSVNGQASAPYRVLHQAEWSFVADAGVGLVVHLGSRLELALEGHGLWAAPEPHRALRERGRRSRRSSRSRWHAHPAGLAMKGRSRAAVALALACLGNACAPDRLQVVELGPSTLPRQLLAHWAFDDRAGAVASDDSGNAHDGQLTGGTGLDDGRFAGALHLGPGEFVSVPAFPDVTSSFTVSAWVRLTEYTQTSVASEEWTTVVSTETVRAAGRSTSTTCTQRRDFILASSLVPPRLTT